MNKFVIVLLALLIFAGCSNDAGDSAKIKEDFDPTYQLYRSLLAEFVQGEKVDYASLKNNRESLDHFIYQLAGTTKKQLSNMSQNAQLAYWINAYNGITLLSIIDNYPIKSIQNINGVWKEKKWYVAGQEITLDYIEHQLLRPTFKDPRIHFGVNCASIGCPPLLNKPFEENTVDSLLDYVASQFIQNKNRHKIDFDSHTLMTTEIFSWFWNDFVSIQNDVTFQNKSDVDRAILNFTYKYLDDSLKQSFDKNQIWKISFSSYDWSLNDIER